MSDQTVDYAALAAQFGGVASDGKKPATTDKTDYSSLLKEFGGAVADSAEGDVKEFSAAVEPKPAAPAAPKQSLAEQMGDVLPTLPPANTRVTPRARVNRPGEDNAAAEAAFQREGAAIGGPVVKEAQPTPNPFDPGVLGQPLVTPSRLLPEPMPGENPMLSGLRGFTEAVEGGTSPAAIATMIGTAGVGELGALGVATQRAATAMFGLGAAKGTYDAGVSGYQKLQKNDVNGAARDWGMGSAEGLFSALMARAAFRGLPTENIQAAWDAWRKGGGGAAPPEGGGPGAPPSGPTLEAVPETPSGKTGGGGGAEPTEPAPSGVKPTPEATPVQQTHEIVDPKTGKISLVKTEAGQIDPRQVESLLDAIIDQNHIAPREGPPPTGPGVGAGEVANTLGLKPPSLLDRMAAEQGREPGIPNSQDQIADLFGLEPESGDRVTSHQIHDHLFSETEPPDEGPGGTPTTPDYKTPAGTLHTADGDATPITVNGKPAFLTPPVATESGKTYHSVVDADGNLLVGGTAETVRNWLNVRHAEIPLHAGEVPLRSEDLQPAAHVLQHPGKADYASPQATGPRTPVSIDTADTAGETHDYSSTQLNLPDEISRPLQAFGKTIPKEELAAEEGAKTGGSSSADGLESESHVTLKYGNPSADPAPIAKALADKGPIRVTLGKASIFKGKDGKPDVLKVEVDSPELHDLNKTVGDAVEHTGNTFPTYKPHVTIAYLKPGEGEKYDGKDVPGVTGKQITLDTVQFSGKDGQKSDIQLSGGGRDSAEQEDKYNEIAAHVRGLDEVSPATLQRQFRLGYGAATHMLDTLQARGVVGPAAPNNVRQVLKGGEAAQPIPQLTKPTLAMEALASKIRAHVDDTAPLSPEELKATIDEAYGLRKTLGPAYVDGQRTPNEEAWQSSIGEAVRANMDKGMAKRKKPPITKDTPIWEMSPPQFLEHRPEEALRMPKGTFSDMAQHPEKWSLPKLIAMSGKDLKTLQILNGLPTKGTKTQQAQRLLDTRATRKRFAGKSVEDITSELNAKQIDDVLRPLGGYMGGNKESKARSILGMIDSQIRGGKSKLAEYNFIRQLQQAAKAGHPVPADVMERYGIEAPGEKPKAELEKTQEGVAEQPQPAEPKTEKAAEKPSAGPAPAGIDPRLVGGAMVNWADEKSFGAIKSRDGDTAIVQAKRLDGKELKTPKEVRVPLASLTYVPTQKERWAEEVKRFRAASPDDAPPEMYQAAVSRLTEYAERKPTMDPWFFETYVQTDMGHKGPERDAVYSKLIHEGILEPSEDPQIGFTVHVDKAPKVSADDVHQRALEYLKEPFHPELDLHALQWKADITGAEERKAELKRLQDEGYIGKEPTGKFGGYPILKVPEGSKFVSYEALPKGKKRDADVYVHKTDDGSYQARYGWGIHWQAEKGSGRNDHTAETATPEEARKAALHSIIKGVDEHVGGPGDKLAKEVQAWAKKLLAEPAAPKKQTLPAAHPLAKKPEKPKAEEAAAPWPPPDGTYMNGWEIERAVEKYKNHPVLSRATRFLQDLYDETNAHSDGWAYWKLPGHAAAQLMGMIQHPEHASEENFQRSLRPIKSFYTKRGEAAGMRFPEIAGVKEEPKEEKAKPEKPKAEEKQIATGDWVRSVKSGATSIVGKASFGGFDILSTDRGQRQFGGFHIQAKDLNDPAKYERIPPAPEPRPQSFVAGSPYEAEDPDGAESTYDAALEELQGNLNAVINTARAIETDHVKEKKKEEYRKELPSRIRDYEDKLDEVANAFGAEWRDRAKSEVEWGDRAEEYRKIVGEEKKPEEPSTEEEKRVVAPAKPKSDLYSDSVRDQAAKAAHSADQMRKMGNKDQAQRGMEIAHVLNAIADGADAGTLPAAIDKPVVLGTRRQIGWILANEKPPEPATGTAKGTPHTKEATIYQDIGTAGLLDPEKYTAARKALLEMAKGYEGSELSAEQPAPPTVDFPKEGTVVIIPCAKSKIELGIGEHKPAEDVYTGDYFKSNLAYARAHGAKVIILSAKYGLIEPDQPITDYDVSFVTKPGQSVKAEKLAQQIAEHGLDKMDRWVVLGGKEYTGRIREAQVVMRHNRGEGQVLDDEELSKLPEIITPTAGMAIGQAKQHVKQATPPAEAANRDRKEKVRKLQQEISGLQKELDGKRPPHGEVVTDAKGYAIRTKWPSNFNKADKELQRKFNRLKDAKRQLSSLSQETAKEAGQGTVGAELRDFVRGERTEAERAYSRASTQEFTPEQMQQAIDRADAALAKAKEAGFTPKEGHPKGETLRTDIENLRHDLYWVKAARDQVQDSLKLAKLMIERGEWEGPQGKAAVLPDVTGGHVDDRRVQPKAHEYADLLAKFGGLSGSWVDGTEKPEGKVAAFAPIYTPDGEKIADVDVKGTNAAPEITVKLDPAFADKPGLEDWIRWLTQRSLDRKPIELDKLRTWAKSARDEFHKNLNRSNRANISNQDRSIAASAAKQNEARAKDLEAQIAELEAGPPARKPESQKATQVEEKPVSALPAAAEPEAKPKSTAPEQLPPAAAKSLKHPAPETNRTTPAPGTKEREALEKSYADASQMLEQNDNDQRTTEALINRGRGGISKKRTDLRLKLDKLKDLKAKIINLREPLRQQVHRASLEDAAYQTDDPLLGLAAEYRLNLEDAGSDRSREDWGKRREQLVTRFEDAISKMVPKLDYPVADGSYASTTKEIAALTPEENAAAVKAAVHEAANRLIEYPLTAKTLEKDLAGALHGARVKEYKKRANDLLDAEQKRYADATGVVSSLGDTRAVRDARSDVNRAYEIGPIDEALARAREYVDRELAEEENKAKAAKQAGIALAEKLRPLSELATPAMNHNVDRKKVWSGNVTTSGDLASDGFTAIDLDAIEDRKRATSIRARSDEARQVPPEAVAKVWEQAVAEATNPLTELGHVEVEDIDLAFFTGPDDRVYTLAAKRVRWLQSVTGADELRGGDPKKAVVLYRGGKPVAILMPMLMRADIDLPTARKTIAAIAPAEPAEPAAPEPSADRYAEILKELKTLTGPDPLGEKHNRRVELEAEAKIHQPAAEERAQQEINADKKRRLKEDLAENRKLLASGRNPVTSRSWEPTQLGGLKQAIASQEKELAALEGTPAQPEAPAAYPNLNAFMTVYTEKLREVVANNPEEYAYPVSQVPAVAEKMRAAIIAGSYNHGGKAFVATAKALGIKPTRTAIEEFISRPTSEAGPDAPATTPAKERAQEEPHVSKSADQTVIRGKEDGEAPAEVLPERVPGTPGRRRTRSDDSPDVPRVPRPTLQTNRRPQPDSHESGERTPAGDVAPRTRKPSAKSRRKPGQRGPDFTRDYRLTEGDHIGEGTALAKAKGNVDAIRVLKAVQKEGRAATPAEQAILAKYTGWGASEAARVFEVPGLVPNNLRPLREELNQLLTPQELKAVRATTVNAHYTSPLVVGAMWDAVRRLGMESGDRVLEPSLGVGNFFGMMPEDLRNGGPRTGIEIDPITGGIAKLLYPGSNVQVTPFEKSTLPNNYFDVAIGNVPFGDYGVSDPEFRDRRALTKSIHNYFFAKALDKVRPGGVIAFVTSSFTMDSQNASVRDYLAQNADLLGAIRLPETAFKANAGTSVTTDIIFLRKKDPASPLAAEPPAWSKLKTIKARTHRPDGSHGEADIEVNEYYAAHPEMMLGKMGITGGRFKDAHTLEGALTPELLAKAIENLPKGALQPAMEAEAAPVRVPLSELPSDTTVKDGGYVFQDGKLMVRDGNELKPADLDEPKTNRVRGMLGVRNAWRNVLRAQEEGTEAEANKARKMLNDIYDAFTRTNGPLSSPSNFRAFASDPDAAPLLSLEESYDSKTKTAKKADIFRKSTNVRYVPPDTAENAAAALAIALNEYGGINWPRIQQLTGLDQEAAQKELTDAGLVFRNPEGDQFETADQYLSGNVRAKLKIAIESAKADTDLTPNVEALEKVQPEDLGPGEIDARLGAGWIPKEVVAQFIEDNLKVRGVKVGHAEAIATWSLGGGIDAYNPINQTEFGGDGWTGVDLVEEAMNLKSPTVRIKTETSSVVDPQATAALREKQQKLKDLFRKWVWEDAARATRLAGIYNQHYNNLRLREFDGSHLQFPGMAAGITLRAHQKNAIWRMLQGGNALLAHVVGAGKTYAMAAAAMEMRRLGTAKKPMLVVPNHLVAQWATEFQQLYPNARLFVAGKDTFSAGNRQKAMGRIANGDYDAVILSHTSFGKLPVKDDTFNAWIGEQIEDLEEAIAEASAAEGEKGPSVKDLEKAKKRLEAKLEKRANREKKDQGLNFEDLGVDQLFVDEFQAYKNLFFTTKMTRIAGIPNTESDRAIDMFLKTQWLTKKRGGAGVVAATGTPISNTMAEMYTVMRYLQNDHLRKTGLGHFDAWAQMYGEGVTSLELAPDGSGYRMNTRFSRFTNLPELATAFRVSADVQTADMLKLPTPKLKGGKPIVIAAEPSQDLKDYVQHLVERAEAMRGKKVDPKEDNMLKITGEGRKAALDMRLVPSIEIEDKVTHEKRQTRSADNPGSKVNLAVDRVYRIWEETKANRSTQLIFSDLSTPHAEGGFSVYTDIRKKLVARGVPEDEIAFIHDYDTDAQKKALFRAVREGRIRVLLGSTEKMGAGMNVQTKLIALHHLDAPWRPSDIEQREGRILRQGNENPEVEIYRYVTKGSFDAYMWQILEAKARFISQVMRGNSSVRSAEDVEGGALTYAEIKGIASGNPRVVEKIKVDMEVRRLDSLRAAYDNQLYNLRRDAATTPQVQKYQTERLEKIEADIERRDNADKLWHLGGKSIESNADAGKLLHEMLEADRDKLNGARADLDATFMPGYQDVEQRLAAANEAASAEGADYVHGSKAAMKRVMDEKDALLKKYSEAVQKLEGDWKPVKLGKYRGFELSTSGSSRSSHYAEGATTYGLAGIKIHGASDYGASANDNNNPAGTLASIRYHIEGLNQDRDMARQNLAESNKRLDTLKDLLSRPFEHAARLAELLKEQTKINAELDLNKNDTQTQGIEQKEQEVEKAKEPDGDEEEESGPAFLDPAAPEQDRRAALRRADERIHNQIREEQNQPNPDQEKIARLQAMRLKPGESRWTGEPDDDNKPLFARSGDETPHHGVAKNADAEYQADGHFALLNDDALTVLRATLSLMGESHDNWNALTVRPAFLRRIAAMLVNSNSSQLAELFDDAADVGEPLVIVHGGAPNWRELVREEQFHRAQFAANQGKMLRLSEHEMQRFLQDPGARAIETNLRLAKYNPDEMSYEIAAHATRGPIYWQEARITPEQAKKVLDLYFRAVERDHGKTIAARLRQLAPEEYDGTRLHHQLSRATDRPQGKRSDRPGNQRTGASDSRSGDQKAAESEDADDDEPIFARTVPAAQAAPQSGQSPQPRQIKRSASSIADAAADVFTSAHTDLQKVFNPVGLSPEGKTSGLSLREHAAQAAQTFARAEEALKEARKLFSAETWDHNLDFINRVEDGSPQPNAQLQKIADTMRELLDAHRLAVQRLGPGKLTSFYENYFPHLWKRGKEAESIFRAVFGKRPIEGTKSFLKKRKFHSFQEGVDAGLVPVSENPVDLVMFKLKEMERYTLAHRFLNEMKGNGLAKFVPALGKKKAPQGWVKIPDQIGTVWAPPFVRIQEAHDRQFIETLLDLAGRLGMDVQRVAKLRGAWGRSDRLNNIVKTRFGGPESVILHEIAHLLDWKYDIGGQLLKDPEYKKELQKLADMRVAKGDTPYFAQYVRRGEEKIANMIAAYGHAPTRMKKAAPKTYRWLKTFIAQHPELAPLSKLSYGLQLAVRATDYPVGGFIQTGNYYMPAGAAQVISNFLSPGFGGKPWYQALRGASNAMLQFALGFSGFHAGFVTFDAMVSKLALALQYAADGKPMEALNQAMRVPIAPITNLIRGKAISKAYLDAAITDPELAKYVDALVEGGGRVKMDEQYRSNMRQRFLDAWRKQAAGTAALTAIPALAELAMWPVLEILVPRMKLGMFADMVNFELSRLGPDATKEDRRKAFSGAWDSVDNRMGQLAYDNLFWNRTAKDLMMISVQSLGWNAGTFRELGGAGFDAVSAGKRIGGRIIRRGGGGPGGPGGGGGGIGGSGGGGNIPTQGLGRVEDPLFTRRMAYAIALVMLTGMIGAFTDYVNTVGRRKADGTIDDGHDRDWRDYFFPRTGGVDEQGRDERMALPGYLKDVVAWYLEPVNSARNKLSPIVRVVAETLSNRNFYNERIWNGDKNTIPENIGRELGHLASFFMPMSISGIVREHNRGASFGMQAGQMVGLRTAPSYITRTPAERYMSGISAGFAQEPTEASKAEREITHALRARDFDKAITLSEKATKSGVITDKQLKLAIKNAQTDPLVAQLNRLSLTQAIQATKLMSPEERQKTKAVFDQKVQRFWDTAPLAAKQQMVEQLTRAGILQ